MFLGFGEVSKILPNFLARRYLANIEVNENNKFKARISFYRSRHHRQQSYFNILHFCSHFVRILCSGRYRPFIHLCASLPSMAIHGMHPPEEMSNSTKRYHSAHSFPSIISCRDVSFVPAAAKTPRRKGGKPKELHAIRQCCHRYTSISSIVR